MQAPRIGTVCLINTESNLQLCLDVLAEMPCLSALTTIDIHLHIQRLARLRGLRELCCIDGDLCFNEWTNGDDDRCWPLESLCVHNTSLTSATFQAFKKLRFLHIRSDTVLKVGQDFDSDLRFPASLETLWLRGSRPSRKVRGHITLQTSLRSLVLPRFIAADLARPMLQCLENLEFLQLGLNLATAPKVRREERIDRMPPNVTILLSPQSSWRNFCYWVQKCIWSGTHTLSVRKANPDVDTDDPARPPTWQSLAGLEDLRRLFLERTPTVELLRVCGYWLPKLERLEMLSPESGERCLVRPKQYEQYEQCDPQ